MGLLEFTALASLILLCLVFLSLLSKGQNSRCKKIDADLNIKKNHYARWLDKNIK